MLRPVALAVALVLCAWSALPRPQPARAEKVDMTPAQLLDTATHAVVGQVVAIYERSVREGSWRVTKRVAELKVERVEKGEGIALGAPLYVRYWTQEFAGPGTMPPGTSGHRGLPREGERVRVYLARNAYDGFTPDNKDGGFNVIGANGFAPPPPEGGR